MKKLYLFFLLIMVSNYVAAQDNKISGGWMDISLGAGTPHLLGAAISLNLIYSEKNTFSLGAIGSTEILGHGHVGSIDLGHGWIFYNEHSFINLSYGAGLVSYPTREVASGGPLYTSYTTGRTIYTMGVFSKIKAGVRIGFLQYSITLYGNYNGHVPFASALLGIGVGSW